MNIVKKLSRSIFSWEVLFVSISTLIMICLYFLVVPFLELVELKAWDLHFKQRGPIRPSGMVAFVTIDEESVNTDGRWPWPRRRMAQLLEAVDRYGARVIGLDMGFFEPDLKLRQEAVLDTLNRLRENPSFGLTPSAVSFLEKAAAREDDDAILAETVKRLSIPLVLGHFFYSIDSTFVPPTPPADVLDKAACPIVLVKKKPVYGRLIESSGLETNIPPVREASRYTGSFNVFADPDGTVRWMPLVFRYEQRIFPSLALEMLTAAFPETPMIVKLDEHGVQDIRIGNVSIPTNDKGEMLLDYYGPAYAFPHFSATTLLHNEAPDDCLKDRLVVIGNTTMGLHDMRPTPFDPVFPGVELHCTVMENVIQGQFLHRSERSVVYYDLGALIGLALCFLILQAFLRGVSLAIASSTLLGGYVLTTHYFFLHAGMWLNHVYPSLNLITAYLGTSVHRYLKEEREKQKIRQTFNLYVHGSVVEEMLAHPERLKLGGEKKELSVLFADIRGFTTLSERLPPEELVPQLNGYLTRMTQVVFDNHGTLDKYIGDALMALFGAPLTQEDHPYRACTTALDMVGTLGDLHRSWAERGLPIFEVGIGINTGVMMVGNMGSERRFDYTVLGDNVNLGSRLEGLTKMYGVNIVVSEMTWKYVKDDFIGRELDIVRVKGRQHPVAIYQLMGKRGDDIPAEPLDVYRRAMTAFRGCDWQTASELFRKVEEWWPSDPPSILYLKRCEELLDKHPGEDWTCVTILDHK